MDNEKQKQRVYTMSFGRVYPLYVAKVERKGRSKEELDKIISWLTGYSKKQVEEEIEKQTDFQNFFAKAPLLNPSRFLIKGIICGVRVEEIKDPVIQSVRYLDKLVDELAKGKSMEKILRKNSSSV